MDKNLHANHRRRMREKFSNHGAAAFNDHELLEMLLYYAIPRTNTNPLAHRLINTYGSLTEIFNGDLESHKEIEGLGEATAQYLQLLSHILRRSITGTSEKPVYIRNSAEAASFIIPYLMPNIDEKLFLVILDMKNTVLYKGYLGAGSTASLNFCAKEIAIRCANTGGRKYYIAHNHPSGIPLPSRSDIGNSLLLEYVLTPMGLLQMDHIICSGTEYVSLADYRMLLRQMHSAREIMQYLK